MGWFMNDRVKKTENKKMQSIFAQFGEKNDSESFIIMENDEGKS